MRRYYALLGALTFSVICTSLYLMTENLANNSQHTQFEPNKVTKNCLILNIFLL